jgi:hypothetical protein
VENVLGQLRQGLRDGTYAPLPVLGRITVFSRS